MKSLYLYLFKKSLYWMLTDHRVPCSWQRTGTAGCCGPARWSSAQPRHHDRCLHLRSPDRPCRRTQAGFFSISWKRTGGGGGRHRREMQTETVNNSASDNSSMKYSAYKLWLLNCLKAYSPSQCQKSPSTAQAWGPHQWGCGHKHATWSHSALGFSVT